jgi:alkanesulfonate monooxygenase SsuD/methylene tetrahydromethanopterin reductase-like flavin-dependent oxidoreductase (luciferase family)
MRLAARHGQAWVTTGDPALYEAGTPEQSLAAVRDQVERISAALEAEGRDPASVPKILLTGFTPDRLEPFASLDAFTDFAGRHAEAGIDELVVHWPIPDSDFAYDQDVFERIATEGTAQPA